MDSNTTSGGDNGARIPDDNTDDEEETTRMIYDAVFPGKPHGDLVRVVEHASDENEIEQLLELVPKEHRSKARTIALKFAERCVHIEQAGMLRALRDNILKARHRDVLDDAETVSRNLAENEAIVDAVREANGADAKAQARRQDEELEEKMPDKVLDRLQGGSEKKARNDPMVA